MNYPEPSGQLRSGSDRLEFPPAFLGHAVPAGRSAFRQAMTGIKAGEFGAGDLVWSRSEDHAAASFVLEPDVPLLNAVQMIPVLMTAIGDALGAIGPPNLALGFRWPGTILANGAKVGSVEAGVQPRCDPGEVPRFLVVGFRIALFAPTDGVEPGHDPNTTYLHEEGCGEIGRTMLVEAIARHFLSWIDAWQADGFSDVHRSWTARAQDTGHLVKLPFGGQTAEGRMIGLDEDGGLLIDGGNGVRLLALHDALTEGPSDDG